MSKQITGELFDTASGANPKEIKKAAPKKAAKKAVVKKEPKEPAKKAVKKVAKKAVTKTATPKKIANKKGVSKSIVVAPILSAPPLPLPSSIATPAPLSPPAPISIPVPLPLAAAQSPAQEDTQTHKPQRVGRVPGGGLVYENHRQNNDPNSSLSRSKKRREKRKRRRDKDKDPSLNHDEQRQAQPSTRPEHRSQEDRSTITFTGERIETNGLLELTAKGFGFLRMAESNYEQSQDDIFISPEQIRLHSLRHGQWLHGSYQSSNRGPQLVEIHSVSGLAPERAANLPHFDELKAINPNKRIAFETSSDRYTTRVVDIVAPVGRGQRGLIVSPPRSGKTTLLLHMAEAIREKYEEQIHLMILLVDERPEEVTEFRRSLPGAEIYASSNDEQARNHCRIAELAIERAKRLVEAGKDVFLLMDSITRLARAYNNNMGNSRGRGVGSGGITIGALEVPRRLFAAARNTRGGGSLTILATALIQTNSRADEAIFMEFKGTGNMELVLDRKIAENYVYPAVDIFKSGTRREELLHAEHSLHKIHLIRRGLSGHRPYEAMERLLFFVKKFPNNPQMLLEIKG